MSLLCAQLVFCLEPIKFYFAVRLRHTLTGVGSRDPSLVAGHRLVHANSVCVVFVQRWQVCIWHPSRIQNSAPFDNYMFLAAVIFLHPGTSALLGLAGRIFEPLSFYFQILLSGLEKCLFVPIFCRLHRSNIHMSFAVHHLELLIQILPEAPVVNIHVPCLHLHLLMAHF